jgi:MtN3 and saliva related transmembrane protein
MSEWPVTFLGMAAGLCTTGSLVPQVLKTLRERDTSAISLRMYLVLIVGFVLWIAYGLIIASWPVVIFNGISLVLGGVMVWLKRQGGRTDSVAAVNRA